MAEDFNTAPRIYVSSPLSADVRVSLEAPQAHYIRNVMRLESGGVLRLFNGADGEYTARIDTLGKAGGALVCLKKIREQPVSIQALSLVFAPIRKHRMDFMIEKAVELGVTALHPVLTAHTQMRVFNEERVRAQMIEAAEQCGRLDIPVLHKPVDLKLKMVQWDAAQIIHFAAERLADAPLLSQKQEAAAFLIGPEGGFDEQETDFLRNLPFIRPVSLGTRILRADTAALFCLTLARRSGA
ncbi:MAG: 16S rRNA (uracil(1498)-N(3))-methyltransferase [Alphaproteobacteria bacterium]|nr:16S rRNA (uracil(1498)-N(3))-methyltransferase [Alphaproteobacteria bacterium]